MMLGALLGSGGGAYVIGALTDVLTPRYGQEGLRYAMFLANLVIVPGLGCFALAGLRSPKDRVA
jgi:hypothetical protein